MSGDADERLLAAPDAALEALFDAARERAFAGVVISLPAQMPFVRVPEVRALLAARGLRCGAVACDARPNALGRLSHGIDSLRQAARAAKSLGASLVPFTVGAHPDRDAARSTGLVGRELRAAAALAAEISVRLGIEIAEPGDGVDPSRTIEGALGLVAAAGTPRWLGLVVPKALLGSVPPAAEPLVLATRERADAAAGAATGEARSIVTLLR